MHQQQKGDRQIQAFILKTNLCPNCLFLALCYMEFQLPGEVGRNQLRDYGVLWKLSHEPINDFWNYYKNQNGTRNKHELIERLIERCVPIPKPAPTTYAQLLMLLINHDLRINNHHGKAEFKGNSDVIHIVYENILDEYGIHNDLPNLCGDLYTRW